MSDTDKNTLEQLELVSTIGFEGKAKFGLRVHPDRNHLVYCLGNTVVIKNIINNKHYMLEGHTNLVSCLEVSQDGAFIASGQINHLGYKAAVIIWDFKHKDKYGSHNVHKVKVEAICFTFKSNYVLSLGGQDCRSVVVWDVTNREPLCGSLVSPIIGRHAYAICAASVYNNVFITGGVDTLRIWTLNHENRKITPTNVPMGQIKREIICLQSDKKDEYCYCGTTSGDILKIRLCLEIAGDLCIGTNPVLAAVLTRKTNKKIKGDSPCFSLGVTVIQLLKTGDLIIGTGDGTIVRAVERSFETTTSLYKIVSNNTPNPKHDKTKIEVRLMEARKASVMGSVTSIALRGDGHQFFIGTKTSEIYRISLTEFICELVYTCHSSPINDVVFPHGCSELFATCSSNHIRVWNIKSSQELLRITVPNMVCDGVDFMRNGRCIISGWNDGKIRAYTPETGKLLYTIHDAHQRRVSAVATTSDCRHVISGGGEGEVRVWNVSPLKQILHATMKEHKGSVTCIRVKSTNKECVSASADGTCIVWNLEKFIRSQVIFANTLFKCVCYGPEECQIITSGTDRKIGYWEIYDGSQIRELDGSQAGAVNAMDITPDGQIFVTGGCDKLLKVWKYQEGEVTHVGMGHSGDITRLRISPDAKSIVSVSNDGAILCWKFPTIT